MAMIKCPECGASISTNVIEECPYCKENVLNYFYRKEKKHFGYISNIISNKTKLKIFYPLFLFVLGFLMLNIEKMEVGIPLYAIISLMAIIFIIIKSKVDKIKLIKLIENEVVK